MKRGNEMAKLILISRLGVAFLTVALILIGNLSESGRPTLTPPLAAGKTFVVNTVLDTPDVDPADGICADLNGYCSLRAAVMQANFLSGPDTIILPAGVYVLTRAGFDDSALVGDLDISDDVTIQGAGSGVTIIDGNGTVTGDRVFQILSNVKNVTFSGLTIRNGQSLPPPGTTGVFSGGGLYMEGAGHLVLSDVIIEGNTALNGGGLYANFSAQGGVIDMNRVIVRNNTAIAGGVGAGGGVFVQLPSSLSTVTLRDSQVHNNTADGTGGGLYIQGTDLAHWTIERSEIYSNTAASGGGIGNFIPLSLVDSSLHDNHANFDGGGIEALSPMAISRTTLNANSAGRFGGGIFNLETGSSVTLHAFVTIAQSTLSGNSAQFGGGIYHDGFINPNGVLTLINSTLSGNVVFRPSGATGRSDGGGLYVFSGQAQLFNVTIVDNRVQLSFPIAQPGNGGGVYSPGTTSIPAASPSVLTVENTIIANNTRGNGITLSVADDCFTGGGTTGTLAFSLIRDNTNCFITGGQVGNIFGQDPLLGPLQNNGGFTGTQALLTGSPAIDAGAQTGCTGAGGVPLFIDQRGVSRPFPNN
jgi:CSLREA domain-containing protein